MRSTWNPYRHKRFDRNETELGRWLDREFPDIGELFVYFHLLEKTWVIARWVNRAAATFYDVFIVGKDKNSFNRQNAAEVRKRVRQPSEHRLIARILSENTYRENRRIADESAILSEQRRPRKIQVVGG